MADTHSTSSRNLPLPDYDHLPTASLYHRIRSLSADELEQILAYERDHADRIEVRMILEARLTALHEGAQPTDGDPTAARPEAAPPPAGDTGVSPQTTGPKMNPPSQGVPSNPAQPRSTG